MHGVVVQTGSTGPDTKTALTRQHRQARDMVAWDETAHMQLGDEDGLTGWVDQNNTIVQLTSESWYLIFKYEDYLM